MSAFSTVKLLAFHPFHDVLYGRNSLHSPHLRTRELCSTSLRVKYLQKLFRIVLHGTVVCSLPFIYSTTYLMSVRTHLFKLWVIIHFYFILFKFFQLWPFGALSVLCFPLTQPCHWGVFLSPYFLALQCAISPRSPGTL